MGEYKPLPQPPAEYKPLPQLPAERKPLPQPPSEYKPLPQPVAATSVEQVPVTLERPRIAAKRTGGLLLSWDLHHGADPATASHTLYRSEFGNHGERILDSVAEIGLGDATSFDDDSLKPATIY